MIKLAVNGSEGRMGSRILALAAQKPDDFKIVSAFDRESSPNLNGAEVLIDFSSPEAISSCLKAALGSGCAIVIGTTGMDPAAIEKIKQASQKIPVLFSANMSLGVNFMLELLRMTTAVLAKTYGYDVEISETHHRLKKDAPSGTAKEIANVITQEMGWNLSEVARYGREGMTGERKSNELGIHVVRSGDVIGDHSVTFAGPGEVLEISHRALSRDVFAQGALSAAKFLSKKPKGLYSMRDALGLG